MKGWFTVSFTRTRAAARKEKKTYRKDLGYKYKVVRNPDKQGWTIWSKRK